jgi:Protein of unknown function (DUF4232)
MKVEREDFERSFERFEMPEPALERLVERRERRRRRERIEAGIAALVVVAATAAVLARAFVVTPVPAGPTLSAGGPCAAPQLRPSTTMEGAAGSREGEIVFTNVSDASCTLQGTPTWLFNVKGDRIDGIDFISSQARWQVEGDPKPAGWPVVTLEPGDRASVLLRWSNWCVQGVLSWDMPLAAGDGIVPIDGIGQNPPPCNGPDQPATIETGPFEPSS